MAVRVRFVYFLGDDTKGERIQRILVESPGLVQVRSVQDVWARGEVIKGGYAHDGVERVQLLDHAGQIAVSVTSSRAAGIRCGFLYQHGAKFRSEDIIIDVEKLQSALKVAEDLLGREQRDGDDGVWIDGLLDRALRTC